MKLTILLLTAILISGGCAGATPGPDDARAGAAVERLPETPVNHRAAVASLFAILDMQTVLESAIDTSVEVQLKASPQMTRFVDILRAFLAKHMGWKSVEPNLTEVYLEAFTQSELEDMVAFYLTPTGKKTVVKLPELMQKGAELGMQRVQAHMGELTTLLEARAKELKAQ